MKALERSTRRGTFRGTFSSRPARRLGLAVFAMAALDVAPASLAAAEHQDVSIRPFRVHVHDADLADLKRRLAATRWPDKETVLDHSQGVPLAQLQELVRHWGGDYDWRKAEARLNACPQFMTKIDGVDVGRDLISAAAQKTDEISVPVAITVFPDEVFRAQEAWARRAFRNLVYFRDAEQGGHFAMWEHPELFAAELRAAFRTPRDAESRLVESR